MLCALLSLSFMTRITADTIFVPNILSSVRFALFFSPRIFLAAERFAPSRAQRTQRDLNWSFLVLECGQGTGFYSVSQQTHPRWSSSSARSTGVLSGTSRCTSSSTPDANPSLRAFKTVRGTNSLAPPGLTRNALQFSINHRLVVQSTGGRLLHL